jgi:hypothetical protein
VNKNTKGSFKLPIVIDDLDETTWELIRKRNNYFSREGAGPIYLIQLNAKVNRYNALSKLLKTATLAIFGKQMTVKDLRSTYEVNKCDGQPVEVREAIHQRLAHSSHVAQKVYDAKVDRLESQVDPDINKLLQIVKVIEQHDVKSVVIEFKGLKLTIEKQPLYKFLLLC